MTNRPPTHIDVNNIKWLTPQSLSGSSHRSTSPSNSLDLGPLSTSSTNVAFSTSNQSQSTLSIQSTVVISPSSSSSPRNSPTKDESISVDPYKVLGVPRDDTIENIRVCYRRLALLSHPRRSISCHEKMQTFLLDGESYPNHQGGTVDEEAIREWHFIVVAACYETLSVPEHRYEYDVISTQIQQGAFREKSAFDKNKNKGFWLTIRKGIDVNDSFDIDKVENGECCGNGCRNVNSFINLCGAKGTTVYEESETLQNNDIEINDLVSKLQSTRGGKKLMATCKPLKMSELHRGRSTATECSTGTDEEHYEFCREETSYLFAGPLLPLYRSRQYKPFTDAFELFKQEFGSDIFRSKSCFDDDDEISNSFLLDEQSSQKWISGGTGRLVNDNAIASPPMKKTLPAGQCLTLVYPVLPNIPLSLLQRYGILDGTTRSVDKKSNTQKSNISTKIKREKQNGVQSEIKTTIKVNGNMRIIRTETTQLDKSNGNKKTSTTVKREIIPVEDKKEMRDSVNESCSQFFELVPCCSFTTPKYPQPPVPLLVKSIDDDSTLSSQSTYLSVRNFKDKQLLKTRMERISIKQNQECREDETRN